jgi:glutamate N-acetyltransferase/amino-acid N-acetyltransferase
MYSVASRRARGAAVAAGGANSAFSRLFATFASADAYLASLGPLSALPAGFRVGTHSIEFRPAELPDRTAKMTLTLIALDKPTSSFAAMFTSNSFPGAPVLVGRRRLASSPTVQAVIVNNKISNVCAPGGVADSEAVCSAVASALKLSSAEQVIPSSTGVIG